MRINKIYIEGPDCAGKSTLLQNLNKRTNFRYYVSDRSPFSTFIYDLMYGRTNATRMQNIVWNDIKSLDCLYVVLLPSWDVIRDRFSKRGDDIHSEESLKNVYNHYQQHSYFTFGVDMPTFMVINEDDPDIVLDNILQRLLCLNEACGSRLIRDTVFNSGFDELVDVSVKEDVEKENINYYLVGNPKEIEYYQKIENAILEKISKEFMGLNEYNSPQTHDSRRFIYSDDSCISLIHVLYRCGILDVDVTFRSSNVSNTLKSDYNFLKHLSIMVKQELNLEENTKINLSVNIRSAHLKA